MMPFPSARLPFRWNLWIAARLMPVFARRRPLGEILKRATPDPQTRAYGDMAPGEVIAAVKAVVARPWRMRRRRCLREGLLAFHYLALSGQRPVLHFAIVPKTALTTRPRAHCWVSLEGQTVMNPPQVPMLELFSYDGRTAAPAQQTVQLASLVHD
ncbi:lasso peptide biosynthesis B2 protein [Mesorhizobium sp. KR2-14]|uniref:lasso peptide biosynthesis B2 protein n=1 Tax=Mesorhizobium sp. KR2-14 TaxID=3156610 RepID=UPI0032B554DA